MEKLESSTKWVLVKENRKRTYTSKFYDELTSKIKQKRGHA